MLSLSVKLLSTMCFQRTNTTAAMQILLALQRTAVTDFASSHFWFSLFLILWIREILSLNHFTTLFLKACTALTDLKAGKRVHYHILKSATKWDLFIQTALLHMYSKCGDYALFPHYIHVIMNWFVMMLGMREIGL